MNKLLAKPKLAYMRYLFLLLLFGAVNVAPVLSQHSSYAEDSLLLLIANSPADTLTMQWYNQLRRLVVYDSPERALEYTRKYGESALKADLPMEFAKSKFYEANSYIPMGEYELALEALFVAEPYFVEAGVPRYIGSLNNSIGAVLEAMERDSQALTYFQRAYETYVELEDKERQAMALNNLSNIYYRQGDFQTSKEMLEQSLGLSADQYELKRTLLNYANTLTALEEYEAALEMYAEVLEDPDKLVAHSLCFAYQGYGKLLHKMGRHREALDNLLKGLDVARQNSFVEDQAPFLEYLAASYEAVGNYERALHYYREQQQLKNQLAGLERDRNLVDALTRYETEMKENEILLLQRDKALASRKQWILGSGAMLLFIIATGIGILLWYRSRSYQRLTEKNRVISKMLEEKEFLIKEIHHRVKNNLQVISSLLQLQSRYVEEPTALAALNDGENRVRSMSIIHHHLYTKENLSQVNVAQYIDSLCDSLLDSYNYKKQDIRIHRDIQPLALDVAVMIPLGLIINELITNAFKYAFEGRQQGQIWVTLREEGQHLLVIVKDDGVGMPTESARRGFGTRLVNTFLRKLEGQAETIVNGGTEVRLTVQAYQDAAPKSQAS